MNNKIYIKLAISISFAFAFLFFTLIHPIYLFDTDDWGNMALSRPLYPSLQTYNPSKVLPEVLIPLISLVSVKLLYPFTNDYTFSVSTGLTLCYILFIFTYIFAIFKFIKYNLLSFTNSDDINSPKLSVFASFFLILIVFFHFSSIQSDQYLFYEVNATCIYHYTIPTILNISLLLFFVCKYDFFRNFLEIDSYLKKFLICFLIYMSIFSNLLVNTHLFFFAIISLTNNLIVKIKNNQTINIFNTIQKEFLSFYILILFCCAAFFEANGLRANSVGSSHIFNLDNIVNSLATFFSQTLFLPEIKLTVFLTSVILFANLIAIFIFFRKQNTECRSKAICLLKKESLLFTILFCIILWQICITVKTGVAYQFRMSAVLSWYSILLLIFILTVVYLFSLSNKILYVLLLLVVVLFYSQLLCTRPYKEINFVPYTQVHSIELFTNSLVEEIVATDKNGVSSLEIHVPLFKSSSADNFPFAVYADDAIVLCLLRQGLIKNRIKIKIVPDANVNKKFSIPVEYNAPYVNL